MSHLTRIIINYIYGNIQLYKKHNLILIRKLIILIGEKIS